ncbi:hypothetical protein CXP35_09110 [Komagataeibacter xylinus]|nr:hypothetical protein CXP35_09110 [Komagataeibacter xylinus]
MTLEEIRHRNAESSFFRDLFWRPFSARQVHGHMWLSVGPPFAAQLGLGRAFQGRGADDVPRIAIKPQGNPAFNGVAAGGQTDKGYVVSSRRLTPC